MQQQEAERLASLVLFGEPDYYQRILSAIGLDCDYLLPGSGRISFTDLVAQIQNGEREAIELDSGWVAEPIAP